MASLNEITTKFVDTSVERAAKDLVSSLPAPPVGGPVSVSSINIPSTPRAKALIAYARAKLPTAVFNHGCRSFFYAMATLDDPSLHLFPADVIARARKEADLDETILAITMLHDLALVPEEQFASSVSFEYQGGLLARDYLKSTGWPREVIDNAAEGSNLHTDSFLPGRVPLATQAAHLGIMLDALGSSPDMPELWHADTINAGAGAYPRAGWNTYSVKWIKEEIARKPGCHFSTALRGFPGLFDLMEHNPAFAKWDNETHAQ